MNTSTDRQDMQSCIEACLHCYAICQQMAMHHCLETGGRHVAPEHLRLMMACAEICRTAAHFMLTGAALHTLVCGACAKVCEACADSCEDVGDMEECARACRDCARLCEEMAGSDSVSLYRTGSGLKPGQLAM